MTARTLALVPLLAAAAALAPGPAAAASGGVPWIPDDYPKALAEARARGVPIVVDAWAPW